MKTPAGQLRSRVWSAFRDPVGSAAVNILPSERPSDIYQLVADKTIEALTDIAVRNEPLAQNEQDEQDEQDEGDDDRPSDTKPLLLPRMSQWPRMSKKKEVMTARLTQSHYCCTELSSGQKRTRRRE